MTQSRTVAEVKDIASNWIRSTDIPFVSAFIGGSASYADPESLHDLDSDIDCYLVIEGDQPNEKIGKITVDGVLLDVSWMSWSQLEHAEANAVFASLLHFGEIVTDTNGKLSGLKQKIDARFYDESSIRVRLEDMRSRIRPLGTPAQQSHLSNPEQVMNWLFPATLATHIPLVKACAPLTVRKRFLAARNVMEQEAYETLLSLYEFDTVSAQQAQCWLDQTATLLDATSALAMESHRFWSSDIQSSARSVAIGGSQKLINAGDHREALYWIIATSARCLTVRADAGIDSFAFLPAFEQMTNSLGIATPEQRAEKATKILEWIDE